MQQLARNRVPELAGEIGAARHHTRCVLVKLRSPDRSLQCIRETVTYLVPHKGTNPVSRLHISQHWRLVYNEKHGIYSTQTSADEKDAIGRGFTAIQPHNRSRVSWAKNRGSG